MLKGGGRHGVTVSKDASSRIIVSFRYDPLIVAKVKTIPGSRWHPDKKYWSFPDSEETLEKIIKVFDHEEVHIDHALEAHVSTFDTNKLTKVGPSLPKGNGGGFETSHSQKRHNLEELRRELVESKYSHKTVKGNLYYNRDFIIFAGKEAPDINESHYLLHLAEDTDLRYIQDVLGHAHSKTTEIYTHVSTKSLAKIRSPLDTLNNFEKWNS